MVNHFLKAVCFAIRYGSIDTWSEMDQALGDSEATSLGSSSRTQVRSNSAAWCLFFLGGRNYETIFDDVLVRDDLDICRDISVLLLGFDEIRAPTKYPRTLSSPLIDLGWKRSFGINIEIWGRYKGPLQLWFNHLPLIFWLVVWNHGILWLSIYWECHHPNWRAYFSEG